MCSNPKKPQRKQPKAYIAMFWFKLYGRIFNCIFPNASRKSCSATYQLEYKPHKRIGRACHFAIADRYAVCLAVIVAKSRTVDQQGPGSCILNVVMGR